VKEGDLGSSPSGESPISLPTDGICGKQSKPQLEAYPHDLELDPPHVKCCPRAKASFPLADIFYFFQSFISCSELISGMFFEDLPP
jgi:hypothetical protein